MIEGLWVVRFLTVGDPEMDLNGGVVVVESGKLFGGDSGYFYVGTLEPLESGVWNAEVTINRHDPNMISVFGDTDVANLTGQLRQDGENHLGQTRMIAELVANGPDVGIAIQLTHVANLP